MLLALSGSFLIAAPDPAQAVEDSLPEQALRCGCLARLLCRCGLRTVIFFAAQHTTQRLQKKPPVLVWFASRCHCPTPLAPT